jgi:hypothetical protein
MSVPEMVRECVEELAYQVAMHSRPIKKGRG